MSNIVHHRGLGRVQHWPKWYRLFGFKDPKQCTGTKLKKKYRALLFKYHPDKWTGPSHCSTTMSQLVNAGKELIQKHGECGAKSDL